jgi:hypothetical protein
MYQLTNNANTVLHISSGTFIALPPGESYGHDYQRWLDAGNTPEQAPDTPPPTQFELDQNRYQKRAVVHAELMSWMASDNMSRVRSGIWTVSQLTSLLSDPAIQAAQTYMSTLSYELAAQSIAAATTPLLTPEIKSAWIAKLQANFFLVP